MKGGRNIDPPPTLSPPPPPGGEGGTLREFVFGVPEIGGRKNSVQEGHAELHALLEAD